MVTTCYYSTLLIHHLKADSPGAEREKQDQYQSAMSADYTSLQFYFDFVYLVLPLLLLNDTHYKSDCILLAIFREMLNKTCFKLLAYVPTLPRVLFLNKHYSYSVIFEIW